MDRFIEIIGSGKAEERIIEHRAELDVTVRAAQGEGAVDAQGSIPLSHSVRGGTRPRVGSTDGLGRRADKKKRPPL